ncbi:hypothetical protein SPBR_08041 [Sporothrix brasiliensis 5110]|uniref:Uncharacterized protein n=1 Tax=Sporothrix brasiliensis 5110 TaxID=1398154 RepID=A0A0C2FBU0_9PEZI|nr:uncharacterized protein SPBR_08041 [Sporothrix brasiliensis 5110]KIH88543.1 hypothetical protein SPBR_08041 [Sporothrix brasiliensis 5110]
MNASQQVAAVAGRSSSTTAATAGGKIVPPSPITVKASTTESFLKDFTLVAEAAKRAQVAVMMRDFENVGLSG